MRRSARKALTKLPRSGIGSCGRPAKALSSLLLLKDRPDGAAGSRAPSNPTRAFRFRLKCREAVPLCGTSQSPYVKYIHICRVTSNLAPQFQFVHHVQWGASQNAALKRRPSIQRHDSLWNDTLNPNTKLSSHHHTIFCSDAHVSASKSFVRNILRASSFAAIF